MVEIRSGFQVVIGLTVEGDWCASRVRRLPVVDLIELGSMWCLKCELVIGVKSVSRWFGVVSCVVGAHHYRICG